ncbi:MMPL family transporter [Sulfobacillus thermosulfidooxidans]|uniref:MMPL family transporter n=1 Tax=Sulfobacillus thermosulfidooxidans TaxID=28034 RepID=UPI0014945E81|nr:MMPL family transporter [Sulfobacillus thermosulfidooxidans]
MWGVILHLTGPEASTIAQDTGLSVIGLIFVIFIASLFSKLRPIRTPVVFLSAWLLAFLLWPAASQLGAHAQTSQLLSSKNALLWADHMSVLTQEQVSLGPISYNQASSWLVDAPTSTLVHLWHQTHGSIPLASLTFYALTHAATIIQAPHHGYSQATSTWVMHLPSADHVTALDANTANTWLNQAVEQSLSRTEIYALGIAMILLMAVLGSLSLTILALMGGALATLYASALMVLLTADGHLSEYSVNIMELLTLGLSIDYSVFLILRFRREYHMVNQ